MLLALALAFAIAVADNGFVAALVLEVPRKARKGVCTEVSAAGATLEVIHVAQQTDARWAKAVCFNPAASRSRRQHAPTSRDEYLGSILIRRA